MQGNRVKLSRAPCFTHRSPFCAVIPAQEHVRELGTMLGSDNFGRLHLLGCKMGWL